MVCETFALIIALNSETWSVELETSRTSLKDFFYRTATDWNELRLHKFIHPLTVLYCRTRYEMSLYVLWGKHIKKDWGSGSKEQASLDSRSRF